MSALRNLVSGVVGGASGRGKASAADTPAAPSSPSKKKETVLVVGGAGFLGRHIAGQLLESRRYASVRVFDIRPCGLEGADERVGDLRKAGDVSAAVKGGCGGLAQLALETSTVCWWEAAAANSPMLTPMLTSSI